MCSICDLQTMLFHVLYGWNLKRKHIKNSEISLVPPGIKPEQKFCVRVDDSIKESEDWTTAFHGTSMKNLPLILEHGLRDIQRIGGQLESMSRHSWRLLSTTPTKRMVSKS